MMMSAVVLMAQAKGHESGQEPPSHAGCFVTNGTTMLTVPFLQEALVWLGFDFGWISNLYMEGCVGKKNPPTMQTDRLSLAIAASATPTDRKCKVIFKAKTSRIDGWPCASGHEVACSISIYIYIMYV